MKMQTCRRYNGHYWYWESDCSIQVPDPALDGLGETAEEAKEDYRKNLINFKNELRATMEAVDKVIEDYPNWEEDR